MDAKTRRRFQFSLRELICVTLILAAVLYAVLCREIWRLKLKLPGLIHDPQSALTLDDAKIILVQGNSADIYDLDSGRHELSIPGNVTAAALSQSGSYAAIGTGTGEIEIWHIPTCTKHSVIAAHKTAIESLSFSADGKTLISSSTDLIARVWNVESGRAAAELVGHTGLIQRAYLSVDGATALTISDRGWGRGDPNNASKTLWGDDTERIWDTRTQAILKSGTMWFEQTARGSVRHDALSFEDRKPYLGISGGTRDGQLEIVRPSYGEPWCIADARSHNYTFEFTNCVGARAYAFFGHSEDIVVTCPLESRAPETTIWQHVNYSYFSRTTYWWGMRLLGLATLVYIIARFRARRRHAALKRGTA